MPRLVESWNTNADGTALTIRIKEGVRFHDGSTLTPETVVRFLQKHASNKNVGLQNVTAVDPSGENTVTLRLSSPDAFLLPALNELMLTHPDNNDVATGPFTLVSRSPIVDVRRFDNYHGGKSALARVTIQTFETQRSAWAALMRHEVDVVQEVSRDSVEFMKGSSSVDTYPSVQAYYLGLIFNQRHSVLKNPQVRRAVVEALDRPSIIERAMRGKGRLAHEDPIWPFNWAYPDSPPRHDFNPQRAADRLDKAGHTLPASGQKGQQRKRLSFKCMVFSEDPQFERIALLIQRQLFDIGVVMEVELLTLETLIKRASAADYDALLIPMYAGRSMDYTYRFWRSGTTEAQMLNSGYTGADELFDQLRRSLSEKTTRRVVNDLVNQFHADVPAVFLAWTEVTRAVSTRFSVGSSGSQDPFFNIWQWRPREVSASR